LTIDKGRFTVRRQAGPGNDINAGSPGFQKAPNAGPASLVARCFLRAEHQLSDAQARSMRTPTMTRIVARTGRRTLSGTRALRSSGLLIDIVVAGLGGVRSKVRRFSINRYPSDAHNVRGLIMIEAGKSLPTINGRSMCD